MRKWVWLFVILTIVLGACGKDDDKKDSSAPKAAIPKKTKNFDEWQLIDTQDMQAPIEAAVLQAYPQYAPPDEASADNYGIRLSYPLTLAPDGEQVVFMFEGDQPDQDADYYLCRCGIDSQEVVCQTVSREFLMLYSNDADIAWAPDGQRFALTAPKQGLIYYRDVDLWLVDYPSLETANLTDDGYNDNLRPGEEGAERALIDTTPIWRSGDLYFMRFNYRTAEAGGIVWGWYRLKDAQGEPEQVFDLTSLTPRPDLVVTGETALTPDGKHLIWSQADYGEDEPSWAVYSLDLAAAKTDKILTIDDLRPFLPDWSKLAAEPENFVSYAQLPEVLHLNADGSHLLVKLYSPIYTGTYPEVLNVIDVELSSGQITPLINYSVYADVQAVSDAFAESAFIPTMLILAPDAHSLFYVVRQRSGDATQFILRSMPLPFAGEPAQIGPIPEVDGLGESLTRMLGGSGGGGTSVPRIWQPTANGRVLIGTTLLQFK
ncbi:MAG TPA: hypothetical protein VHP83_26900 [Aggregatilineaceae bacterium]|nr:hypothetical protein [Aggregatilineaceae bacterium]